MRFEKYREQQSNSEPKKEYIQTMVVKRITDWARYRQASEDKRKDNEQFKKHISPEELVEKLQKDIQELPWQSTQGLKINKCLYQFTHQLVV